MEAKKLLLWVIFLCVLSCPHGIARLAAQPVSSGDGALDKRVTVYLLLEGDPVAATVTGAGSKLALAALSSRARSRAVQVQSQHAVLQGALQAAGAQVTGRFLRLANAIRVRVPEAQLARLASLPGVRRVERVPLYHRALSSSVPFVGAPRTWSGMPNGADGRGIRIGIIDSGIDYMHADFGGSGKPEDFAANDPTRIEPGSFPTAKVVGGFDFAGDKYNPDEDGNATPIPDPDPLDCASFGHGTHVAGIAAGFGVLTNGLPYTGAYSAALDFSQFSVGPGVAPRALLYSLKVFGCDGPTGLVTDALEWAADPNGDFDFSDRLDVVNLSLGGRFGSLDPEASDVAAANRLSELGCVVVCAAGNGDNIFYTVSAPGIAERAISVANVINQGKGQALAVTSPAAIAGNYYFIQGGITVPLTNAGPVSGRLIYVKPNLGCEDFENEGELRGQIALIDRGTCFFSDKILRAQEAGAIAVVMVNNQNTAPIVMGGDLLGITIPGGMISKSDGDLLKARLEDGVQVRLDAQETVNRPEFIDTLNDSSSRGPGSPGSLLKPDISAPGTEIVSAKAGAGSEGVAFTGTSMSTPTVAGAAALLRQLHPSWTAETIKAALMNTALPIADAFGVAYPESRMGAGRLRVDAAASAVLTASQENANGRVGVSFGSLSLAAPYEDLRTIRIANHGTAPLTCRVTISNSIAQSGIKFSVLSDTVTVPANGDASVKLRLQADPKDFDLIADETTEAQIGAGNLLPRHFIHEASGHILFSSGQEMARIPFHVNARAASDFRVEEPTIVLPAALSTLVKPEVALRFRGGSVSSNALPLVSVFQLGTTSPDKRIADPNRAVADLLAVGAATDIATAKRVADSTVYFGIASAGSWTTPQSRIAEFDVLVDTNEDGRADLALFNGAASITNRSAGDDVFMSVVVKFGADRRLVSTNVVSYLNVYAADELDTAVFNNSVMVLSAPADALGLTEAAPSFRYRVFSYAPSGSVDETDWIPFNAARPVVDTTDIGGDGTPIYVDGTPFKVRVDREVAMQQGHRLPRLLLLHHFGLPSKRFEVVTLDLRSDDTDDDRIPDWWEQERLGGLAFAGAASDIDGDGASDALEFLSNTDPKDATSRFKVQSATRVGGNQIAVVWSSVAGQTYTLERASNLAEGFKTVVAENVKATPPLNTSMDSFNVGSSQFFYRIRLQK